MSDRRIDRKLTDVEEARPRQPGDMIRETHANSGEYLVVNNYCLCMKRDKKRARMSIRIINILSIGTQTANKSSNLETIQADPFAGGRFSHICFILFVNRSTRPLVDPRTIHCSSEIHIFSCFSIYTVSPSYKKFLNSHNNIF